MKKEIEVKFKIKNRAAIREKLKKAGAKLLGKAFERTTRFDTENKKLEKQGEFLRVRTGFKNTITLKKKLQKKDKDFREREEIEFEISDPKEMEIILEKLGFTKKRIMEKYREKWILGKTEIVIDKLPMGNFIEIEGSKKEIIKAVKNLELNFNEKITDTYWDLWEKFSREKNIKSENIIF